MRIALVLLLALASLPARGFGPVGHDIVAEIAAQHLAPATRAEVERLLGDRASPALREWASWADELRHWPGLGPTGPLHYVNFPRGECRYVPARDCRGGRCVVGALEHFATVLRDRARSDRERADALKWVLHLVADVHQPLHAAWGDDRGGNTVQLRYRGQGTNLHALLDSGLLRTRGLRAVPYARELLRRPAPTLSPGDARAWALESCEAARSVYPAGAIDADYEARVLAVLETRMHLAGLRLARLLDEALAPR